MKSQVKGQCETMAAMPAMGARESGALAKEKLDIDHETIVIFQLLLEWRGNKAVEIGPYVGGGGPRSGTAWVYDDAKLDARLLSSRKPGGYYAGPCSLGQFNTHYIGGVAHEFGHALGLPHDCEPNSDLPRGAARLWAGEITLMARSGGARGKARSCHPPPPCPCRSTRSSQENESRRRR